MNDRDLGARSPRERVAVAAACVQHVIDVYRYGDFVLEARHIALALDHLLPIYRAGKVKLLAGNLATKLRVEPDQLAQPGLGAGYGLTSGLRALNGAKARLDNALIRGVGGLLPVRSAFRGRGRSRGREAPREHLADRGGAPSRRARSRCTDRTRTVRRPASRAYAMARPARTLRTGTRGEVVA